MADTIILAPTSDAPRQVRVIAVVFAIIVAILGGAWYFVVRGEQAVLASNLRPPEAAALVEELKKENIEFGLKDNGTTVLVPASAVDALRVSLSSTEMPAKGTVGFELFNQSDMGLTDFAQKVNYQRALQGELARTIMTMDGIASARVHLALPERSLFRANRAEPRAAVTVAMQPMIMLDNERVAGIQRLVSAAIPDLAIDQVAILNSRGQLVSTAAPSAEGLAGIQFATALERAYADRVNRAVSEALPELRFEAKVTTIPKDKTAATGSRDYAIRVVLFSEKPIAHQDQETARTVIAQSLALEPSWGDEVSFAPIPSALPATNTPSLVADVAMPAVPSTLAFNWLPTLLWSSLFVLLTLLALIALNRSRRGKLLERDVMVNRIRAQLKLVEAVPNGR